MFLSLIFYESPRSHFKLAATSNTVSAKRVGGYQRDNFSIESCVCVFGLGNHRTLALNHPGSHLC